MIDKNRGRERERERKEGIDRQRKREGKNRKTSGISKGEVVGRVEQKGRQFQRSAISFLLLFCIPLQNRSERKFRKK